MLHDFQRFASFMAFVILFAALVLLFSAPRSHANSDLNLGTDDSSSRQRSYRLGLGVHHFPQQITASTNQTGLGFIGVYEFHLSPRFTLGIDLELRHLGGEAPWSQLGYGLLMKHFLSPLSESGWTPYLEYGLLMSVSRQTGVEGAGTAHDTRLAVGAEGIIREQKVFIDFSYHYSRLGFFNVDEKNLDYLQLNFGWKFKLR